MNDSTARARPVIQQSTALLDNGMPGKAINPVDMCGSCAKPTKEGDCARVVCGNRRRPTVGSHDDGAWERCEGGSARKRKAEIE